MASSRRTRFAAMLVDIASAKFRHRLGDSTYYFLQPGLPRQVQGRSRPHRSVRLQRRQVAEGAVWTCPMHPEIRRDGPGSCPICGMALEPLEPTLEDGPNPELVDMTRRFWISAVLIAAAARARDGAELFGCDLLPMRRLDAGSQLALATPVVLWGGWPFFERGWASLKNRSLNMFTLIGARRRRRPTATASWRRSSPASSRRRSGRWAARCRSTSRRRR